ncbi:MAG: hypothetical protein IKP06_03710 [Elusimicrobiaceae bacterium]|nr:hypothetical protein [Elusimicrobiaceae bacterium]
MLSYKKYFVSFLLCILTATLAGAQGRAAGRAAALGRFPKGVSKALENRVIRTYHTSLQAQQDVLLPVEFIAAVYRDMFPQLRANWKELYPDVLFLSNAKQATNYFLARNNRDALTFLTANQKRIEEINRRLDDLKSGRKSIEKGEEINWIISQIPKETSCLLLGEYHDVDDIRLNIAKLLTTLREQNPKRPIVLLTEFLPERSIFGRNTLGTYKNLIPVWLAADQAKILVLGLEPNFVLNNHSSRPLDPKFPISKDAETSIWASYEGLRVRNNYWATFINGLRQTMPKVHPELSDALFIVYAGDGHTAYHEPYSLPSLLPDEKIFSVAFYPTYDETKDGLYRIYETSDFDRATQNFFTHERTVQFKDPELAKLAGFNIRLKVEPIHKIEVDINISRKK